MHYLQWFGWIAATGRPLNRRARVLEWVFQLGWPLNRTIECPTVQLGTHLEYLQVEHIEQD